MTREELMVIAAAMAVFIVINIIMWTIIAKIEKRQKTKKQTSSAVKAAETKVPTAALTEQTPIKTTVKKPMQIPREPRSDFVLIDDIVITHTDEFI
ncbi:MAG: hypothetical protein NC485_01445 [Ruminococcus flavefaciens]|nr:hypothetical protein [Ruminococcus flavefaciens]MCM1061656.1 hypothetical protein [Eubacterium sp.]